jgi:RND family efflux transporter MFP subunit
MKIQHLFLFLPLILMGCRDADPQQLKEKLLGGASEERIVTVGVQRIDSVGGLVRNTYPGYLEGGRSADMTFKYGGTLQRLYVREGSQVQKGQVLANVSSPSLESSRRSALATLEQAQDAYNRLKKVHDNGSLPEIKWQEMVTNLEKAQAAYDLANTMLNENVLVAPFSGTVTDVNAEIGENVTPIKPVMKIIGGEGLVVKITVPENEIALLREGEKAEIFIPALGDKRYAGKVVEKSMTATMMTHSYPVKVQVKANQGELIPGMTAKVVLKSDVNKGIVVPANAILINQNGKFVWVAEDSRATRRYIKISGYSGSGVLISEGLHPGDIVIVEGYQKISEGMQVKYE